MRLNLVMLGVLNIYLQFMSVTHSEILHCFQGLHGSHLNTIGCCGFNPYEVFVHLTVLLGLNSLP